MKVTFYGTRGSISVSEPEFSQFGGNTSCVLVTSDSGRIGILDAGTGIRKLGQDILSNGFAQQDNIFIGLSHTHWDHIQGFPFFKPAYDPNRHFTIAIAGKKSGATNLESIFAMQMQREYFPVSLSDMGAHISFWQPETMEFTTSGGISVQTSRHNHPGNAYGYRITEGSTTLVYCTDVEHGEHIDPNVVSLAQNADLLIHDAQYTPKELKQKKGWGHSSWEQAIEVALQANVKKLALFHHDPEHDDTFLLGVEKECQRLFANAVVAREGMVITL
jgi:phosphoribosyl 1,2-cyclic phosphodiesterase